jgi:UDP-glucose:glycoprotein glucosyltransferase
MDVPSSWLVRPREAMYDLDNIQLGNLAAEDRQRGVEALFALDFLVVEGHARESLTNFPPRGLQLQLTNGKRISIDDTQVVANLGYFQFKAEPGVFHLEIRRGRGREVYRMVSVGNEGWDSPPVEDIGDEITVTSFEGLTLYPRLTKQPGMLAVDVLAELRDNTETRPKGIFEELVSGYLHSPPHSHPLTRSCQSQICSPLWSLQGRRKRR